MATDDQELARAAVDPLRRAEVIHPAYEKINEQVKQGVNWNKCPNCGEPYIVGGADWPTSGSTLCSEKCEREYLDYLNDPGGW